MINKRLINIVPSSKKYIFGNVVCQWCVLLTNVVLLWNVTLLVAQLWMPSISINYFVLIILVILCLIIRFILTVLSQYFSHLSSCTVKIKLRKLIYEKLNRLGMKYNCDINTSEVVTVAVEGVDQLEIYFGSYLPQFFYSFLAPLTLFLIISRFSFLCAIVLFVCMPLIPISIIAINRWAKKLLSKYWGQYVALSDSFLENLEGLTTLKIYQADEFKMRQMDEEAQRFRRITMKVLTMQLNSISIMDIVAYGGAAVGIILAVISFVNNNISLHICLFIILLSADFFIPMRLLGSFFHVAMNGIAASKKIFRLLDLEEPIQHDTLLNNLHDIEFKNVNFAYQSGVTVLSNITFKTAEKGVWAIVGKSGCGKSTLANLLTLNNRNYDGSITVGGLELNSLSEANVLKNITYIGHNSYLFKGSVRDNLLIANPNSSDYELESILVRVNLWDFLISKQGLDTVLNENASNLSGGQRQRLALARALLHNSYIYIFDEATSNIDVESENIIMNEIYNLKKDHLVILISHRLANVVLADEILVLEKGMLLEKGNHDELLSNNGVYADLWQEQFNLENYEKLEN